MQSSSGVLTLPDVILDQYLQAQSTALEPLRGLILVPKTFFQTIGVGIGDDRQQPIYQSPNRERRSFDSLRVIAVYHYCCLCKRFHVYN